MRSVAVSSPIIRDYVQKIACHAGHFTPYMTLSASLIACRSRPRSLILALAAALAPPLGLAQGVPVLGSAPVPVPQTPVEVWAESMTGRPDREVFLQRDVEIHHGSTIVNADQANYNVLKDEVGASGNIIMQREKDRYTGDTLELHMETGEGFITHPTYRLGRNQARGNASRIDFEAEDRAVVVDGTYSTCEAADPDWYLQSNRLHLDSGRDIGTAGKTIVFFKGVPILGMPAMSFPLSEARKSGVLPPSYGATNKGGIEIGVPYYFNLAPNRDLTLYPKVIAQRGLQIGAEARYLGTDFAGETRFEFMPNDRLAGAKRYALTSLHQQNLAPGWSLGWNLNAASDNDYPSHFPSSITTSSQRLLGRDLNLNYAGDLWRMTTRTSKYQLLQDPLAPIQRPYDRLPQINLQVGQQDQWGFDWNVDAEMTRFVRPPTVLGDPLVNPTSGSRFMLNPQLSYPILHSAYFLKPKLAFDLTQYDLLNVAPGDKSNFSRALPTFSLDGGLVFERETGYFGQAVTQTLEPRMFYVRTPYRNQSYLPNFDTVQADLSFYQLFAENRFIGRDRISDANQITLALSSRFIEQNGAERMRLTLGQRFYLSKQLVTLGAISNESRSDLLLSAQGRLTQTVTAEGNVQYSESLRQQNVSNFGVHWQPEARHILNLQYRRDLLNNLEQADLSTQWLIAQRWYGVGRVNYSLPDKKIVEGLFGVEYKADCWVLRVVGQRKPTATGVVNSSLFFQLELNGLTRIGPNPLDALRNSIPGYQLINQR